MVKVGVGNRGGAGGHGGGDGVGLAAGAHEAGVEDQILAAGAR